MFIAPDPDNITKVNHAYFRMSSFEFVNNHRFMPSLSAHSIRHTKVEHVFKKKTKYF